MLEREGFIHGVPCWIDSGRRNGESAVEFYGKLFGWEFTDIAPPEIPGQYLVARLDGKMVAAIGVAEGNPANATWNTYIQVDDADASAKTVVEAGGSVTMEPVDAGEAGRMGFFADPAGAVFAIWQPGVLKGAELVNSPGSWNSSDLHTTDVKGAETFYGSVFGWETDMLEFGGFRSWLFRLPGYGDFLEQFDPEIRTRQASQSAPSGFEDAVGWMSELNGQPGSDGSPRFVLTFTVADTDATVRLCEELGGTVLQPAVNIGPVREAVLADPEGAVFRIGKYDPNQQA
jgi:predicted enzyme related to lactoylglutathione lyase